MHLNAFFLKALAAELNTVLKGALWVEAFSQERDEVVLEFQTQAGHPFFIRACLRAELSYLAFPDQYHRARSNTASLFETLQGQQVQSVEAVPYDRSFWMGFSGGFLLLFKLHGAKANLVLYKEGTAVELFKRKQVADLIGTIDDLAQTPDLSLTGLEKADGLAWKLVPSIGPESKAYLSEKGYLDLVLEDRYVALISLIELLERPKRFYICQNDDSLKLLFWPRGGVLSEYLYAIQAAQAFAKQIGHSFYLDQAKRDAAKAIAKRREQTVLYLDKIQTRLHALEESRPISQIADLVMAQLHLFTKNQLGQPVAVDDFYQNGQISITLKEGQTPQAYAETLYRKAKHQTQEVANLRQSLDARSAWLESLSQAEKDLETLTDVKAVRALLARLGPIVNHIGQEETLPYRAVWHQGWEIRIGKNALSNDAMLRGYAHKDDLWLHAKDVPGSHVLICRRPGLPYPKDVIEFAASLAAYHSKKRTEGLANVAVTERKYVRKVKGSPAGSVRVERERVLLVPPKET